MAFKRLTWGVKESFRRYVEAAEGSITASDGATRNDEGCFVFEARPGGDLAIAADGSATGAMRFQGAVTFEAHGGMLKTTLSDLAVEAGEDGLALTAPHALLKANRCEIAKLSVREAASDEAVLLSCEMTLDGTYQIADNYPPGTELDPVRLD